jgi:dehypoxanthine futalosine cyclase
MTGNARHADAAPEHGARLSPRAARDLFRNAPLPQLMRLADERRLALHGKQTFLVHSLNLNPTNICENRCELCAFWRRADDPSALTVTLEAAEQRLRAAAGSGLTDLHIVGGLAPGVGLDYYERLLRMAGDLLPGICIQALTAVEIDYLAATSGRTVRDVLQRLKAAGLNALPGGGAEIFAAHVRRRICPNKIAADRWLEIHAEAHALGLPTNATMLFGHVEGVDDLVDHMDRLRRLQDRTGGFAAFIPLPFHPQGTRLDITRGPSGAQIVRTVAVARLFLDNIAHVRVLANYVDRKLLEVLARSGVDDLGGTSREERIARAAGAPRDHRFVSVPDMFAFVRRLGLVPRLVNSVYAGTEQARTGRRKVSRAAPARAGVEALLERAAAGERLSGEAAVILHDEAPFQRLGELAHAARLRAVPGDRVTFVMDRNISLTNVCTAGCRFCAFHVKPGNDGAFVLSAQQVVSRVREAMAAGATQVLIQGGLNPDLPLEFYEGLLREVKRLGDICVHSLSPPEIADLAARSGRSVRDTLLRLQAAGLDSLPGGGAELLVDAVRRRVSPHKLDAAGWIDVMRTAHGIGLRSTATMVYGLGENGARRVEHLLRLRRLQDETGGFTAFIPWSFQSGNTALTVEPCTGVDYLRVLALSRLVLDNIAHVQAGWVTEGPDVAQLALAFGADDFGGVLMEEKVVSAAAGGPARRLTRDDVTALIRRAGWTPVQRTTQYAAIREW